MMMSKNMMWGLIALAAGAGIAAALMPQARGRRREAPREQSARVDQASEESFPASDPPSFSGPAVAVPGPTS